MIPCPTDALIDRIYTLCEIVAHTRDERELKAHSLRNCVPLYMSRPSVSGLAFQHLLLNAENFKRLARKQAQRSRSSRPLSNPKMKLALEQFASYNHGSRLAFRRCVRICFDRDIYRTRSCVLCFTSSSTAVPVFFSMAPAVSTSETRTEMVSASNVLLTISVFFI